ELRHIPLDQGCLLPVNPDEPILKLFKKGIIMLTRHMAMKNQILVEKLKERLHDDLFTSLDKAIMWRVKTVCQKSI
ncbi:MAG: hypothetical protein C4293_18700, partial [Nitrospiraceae bacterium]